MDMDFALDDILDYVRENLSTVLAVAIMVLLLLSYIIFTILTLIPRWQQRAQMSAVAATAEAAYSDRTTQQQAVAGQIEQQIEAAQVEFDESANRFLTEAQAAAFLADLYDAAAATAVSIVDLQAQAVPQGSVTGEKPVYDTRQFQLVVEGELPQLNEFVGRIEATAVTSINIQNLSIAQGADGFVDLLTLDLFLYTSPFSSGGSVAELPEPSATAESTANPLPSPTPTTSPTPNVNALLAQLDDPWAAENWPEVIRIIQEVRQLAPAEVTGTGEKLYAARVNYGYQLAEAGETAAAAEQFELALAIFPQGTEAEAGLQALLAPEATPIPEVTVYIVQRGDTLFSIARRYGSSVEAVKAANGLVGNNITPGQELIIP